MVHSNNSDERETNTLQNDNEVHVLSMLWLKEADVVDDLDDGI